MREKTNRIAACLLSMLLMLTCFPAEVYSAEEAVSSDVYMSEDMIIEEADEVPEETLSEEEPAEEEDAYIPEEEVIPEEEAKEAESPDVQAEEYVGVQSVSEFVGTYDVRIIWPDGGETKRLLTYRGSDKTDVENSIIDTVASDLARVDLFQSEYTCSYIYNKKKSTTVRTTVYNDNNVLASYLTTITDYYDVRVEVIQPEFTEEEGDAQILAHRGTYTSPENTLAAFRMCAVKGFHYIGADVHFTADGVPVILHDETLNRTVRTADGKELSDYVYVEKTKYSDLKKYDAGVVAGSFWKGEKVPTFEEFIILCRKLDLIPNIHIKPSISMSYARLFTLADIVRENGMQGRVVWAADDIDYLRFIKTADPVSGLDLVAFRWVPSMISMVNSLKTERNFVEIGLVKSAFSNEIAVTCAYNGILTTTSANTEAEMKKIDASVRVISTDALSPNEAREYARKRKSTALPTTQTPAESTDYRLLAATSTPLMLTIKSSALGSAVLLKNLQSYTEMNDFRFKKLADGCYQILNTRSMLALEVKGGNTADCAAIVLGTWDASDKQRWKIVSNANGSVTLVNKATGKAIQPKAGKLVSGTTLVQKAKSDKDIQQFWLATEPKQVSISYTGTYYLTNDSAAGYAAGVQKGSTATNANICLVKKASNDSQKYKLYYSGDGYYRIMNVKSKMFITVQKNSAADGANIIQDTWKNTKGQRWLLKQNKDGSYILTSKIGTCLQVDKKTTTTDINVSAGTRKGQISQHWRLAAA